MDKMDWKSLIDQITPVLVSAMGAIITIFMGWIASALQKRANVAQQDSDSARIQRAFETGATEGAVILPDPTIGSVASHAVKFAQDDSLVAESIRRRGLSVDRQASIATAKATEALAKVASAQAAMKREVSAVNTANGTRTVATSQSE